jgi:hypothetical protein
MLEKNNKIGVLESDIEFMLVVGIMIIIVMCSVKYI